MTITIQPTQQPISDNVKQPVVLSDITYEERKEKILALMKKYGFSSLIIYADKEHGSNFEYLTGFIPRFEEALQILTIDGTSTLLLGNENANKVHYARVKSQGIKCPLFSLPNQPMDQPNRPMAHYLEQVSLDTTAKVGLVDWKLLSHQFGDFHRDYSVPAFIVDAIKEKVGGQNLYNATALYIHPEEGARVTNNAEEILRYEYGASLASDAILETLNGLHVGQTELEAGNMLNKDGQYPTVVTIAAFGERFKGANLYPTDNTLKTSDKVALTVAYKGGLSSRSGYAVHSLEDLERVDSGYFEEVVKPYFEAYKWWLDHLRIGVMGGEIYDEFNTFYPQDKFGWHLCPGHLVSDEEWLSSPFYKNSSACVRSGSIYQVDFIPSQKGHHGVSAESTVAIASKELRTSIQKNFPEMWQRIEKRKKYLSDQLGLILSEELLPLGSTLGYYTPFMLDTTYAIHY